MAPVTEDKIVPKRTNDDESDEGFVSPSVDRVGLRNKKDSIRQSESESVNCSSDNDNDSQALHNSDEEMEEHTASATGTTHSDNKNSKDEEATHVKINSSSDSQTTVTPSAPPAAVVAEDPAAESKAEQLAKFVVYSLLEKYSIEGDKVERTLLRCVKMMMQKHEILFKGMMKRVQVTRETGYVSFVTVANTLFEEDKMVITWSRIVALYAFGGQLALYCKEKGMEDFACTVADFMGKYAKEMLTPFVTNIGGWSKICDEFPEETDLENRVRRVLSWTAVGLGVAATVSYLTSR